jgi:hypothetical protein
MSLTDSPRFAGSPPPTPGAPRVRTIPLPELDVLATGIHPPFVGVQTPIDFKFPLLFRRSSNFERSPIGPSFDTNQQILTPLRPLESPGFPSVAARQHLIESYFPLLFRRCTLPIDPPHAATNPMTHWSSELSPIALVFMEQPGTENRDENSPSQLYRLEERNCVGVNGTDAEFCPHCAAMEQPDRTLIDVRELASRR